MRISSAEIHCFVRVLSNFINGAAELRLFGSRVDDQSKGGDFDLLLIVPDKASKDHLQYYKADMLSQIKAEIGEQKIDLLIIEKDQLDEDPFIRIIFPKSVSLKTF